MLRDIYKKKGGSLRRSRQLTHPQRQTVKPPAPDRVLLRVSQFYINHVSLFPDSCQKNLLDAAWRRTKLAYSDSSNSSCFWCLSFLTSSSRKCGKTNKQKNPQCNTHHYKRRGASYQAVHEQPPGSAEDAVKELRVGNLLLLLLVHNSPHKQLRHRDILCHYSFAIILPQ